MAIRLQELIHKYEQGAGHRTLKFILAFIVLITVAVCYDLTAFRNLSTPEGMDAAQLARNICEGKGFTTDFIRPLSVYLIERKTRDAQAPGKSTGPPSTNQPPPAAIDVQQKLPHPDLANPPVYPILLAGALKLMPFAAPDLVAQQKRHEDFKIYKPDLWIALFNQLLFLLAVCMVFSLARKLFDEPVAWVSAAVFLGTDLFWRFSISGLSTILLIVIFLALISVLARMESTARESAANRGWLIMWAVIAGLLG